MGKGIFVAQCRRCRICYFPDRLRCRACGSVEFRQVEVTSGRIVEVTTRPGAKQAIATVSCAGMTVIARVPATTRAGVDIRLTRDPGELDAAFVPMVTAR